MTPNMFDPEFAEPAATSSRPDLLVAAVLHLMTHYVVQSQASGGCLKLACVIERHFKALAELSSLAPVLQATCLQLSEYWATVVDQGLPRADQGSFFSSRAAGTPAH